MGSEEARQMQENLPSMSFISKHVFALPATNTTTVKRAQVIIDNQTKET